MAISYNVFPLFLPNYRVRIQNIFKQSKIQILKIIGLDQGENCHTPRIFALLDAS